MNSSRQIWILEDRRYPAEEPVPIDDPEEELEARTALIERGDTRGLVAHMEDVAARRPDDAYVLKDLGEAYVMNGESEKALELLAPVHRRHPHFESVQWVILDALFALGGDETCFDWVEEPEVVRLDGEALDLCHRILEQRGVADDSEGLYCGLLCRGYCAFSEEELLEALEADGRFEVEGDEIRLAHEPPC